MLSYLGRRFLTRRDNNTMNCSQVSFQIVIPAEVLLAHITLESIFPGVGEHVTLQMPVWGKQFRTVGTVELVIQGGSVARRHVSSFLHVVLHFSLHFFRILPNKGRVFVSQILQWKACREIFVLALAVILVVVCCHCFAVVQLNKQISIYMASAPILRDLKLQVSRRTLMSLRQ